MLIYTVTKVIRGENERDDKRKRWYCKREREREREREQHFSKQSVALRGDLYKLNKIKVICFGYNNKNYARDG